MGGIPPQHKQPRDSLTGVYSRASFDLRLGEAFDEAARNGGVLSLLLIDLDHFKSINDGFGHARGDAVLVEFARRLQNVVRATDLPFRFGGDEFVLILPSTDRAQAEILAQRLLDNAQTAPFVGEPPLTLTLSIGVATYPADATTAKALFEAADRRVYFAKRAGRAQVVGDDSTPPSPEQTVPFSRLIERDGALESLQQFAGQIQRQTRSVLRIAGSAGSGLTCLLAEAGKAAQMRNYSVISLQGSLSLRNRVYGAWFEAQHDLGPLPSPALGPSIFTAALQASMSAHKSKAALILVDNNTLLDHASADFLRGLYFAQGLDHLAIAYTDDESQAASLLSEVEHVTTVTAAPLSLAGTQIWLRHSLQWEAPAEFVTWLYRETGGRPAFLKRGLDFLIENHTLEMVKNQWRYQPAFARVPLAEKLAQPILPPNYIPDGLTPFVRREQEIRSLKQRTREERLVTLFGPGGIGKSRLAIQVAEERLMEFRDGVFFVPLSALKTPDSIIPAIAEALRFQFFAKGDPKEQLLEFLRAKHIFFILDNFEHLREGAPLLLEILSRAPGARLLVTSRDPLGLPKESLFELDSLGYPVSETAPDIAAYEAVQLFLQVSGQARSEIKLTQAELCSVARICRLVEGMPLGLELAAAWTRVIPLAKIAEEIERNLAFLATDRPEIRPHHRSMVAVIDSFWQVLSELEQDAISQLAVFSGGFQHEAARQVAGVSPLFLDALVAKAYLHQTPHGRYEIHELLRQYAADKLHAKEPLEEGARARHCAYFLSFVCAQAKALHNEHQAIEQISAESENVRAAWQWAVDHDRLDLLRAALPGLVSFYDLAGRWEEGRQLFAMTAISLRAGIEPSRMSAEDRRLWVFLLQQEGHFLNILARYDGALNVLERAREECGKIQDPQGLSRILTEAGVTCWRLGDYAKARGHLEEALALAGPGEQHEPEELAYTLNMLGSVIWTLGEYPEARVRMEQSLNLYREAGNKHGMALALNGMGNLALDQCDYIQAQKLYEESLAIRRELGDKQGIAATLNNLGILAFDQGDYAASRARYEESLDLLRELDDLRGIALTLDNLGGTLLAQGDYARAQALSEESLIFNRQIGEKRGIAYALNSLGNVALAQGDHRAAQTMQEESLGLSREMGEKRGAVYALNSLGNVASEQEDFEAARAAYGESLALAQEIGDRVMVASNLVGLAGVLAQTAREAGRAAKLAAAAEARLRMIKGKMEPFVRSRYESALARAQEALDDKTFAEAWAAGQELSVEQAVECALSREEAGSS